MKKRNYVLALVIILILVVIGLGIKTFIHKNETQIKQYSQDSIIEKKVISHDSITVKRVVTQDSVEHKTIIRSKDTIPSNWKTYNNSALGVSFKYPKTWTKNGEESNSINRNGEVMSISVNLIDTISNSNFYLAYHIAPYGAEVYRLAEDDYNSSKNSNEGDTKQITVSGNIAIETFTTMSKDIKGNIYDPALKLIHIVFLDRQKTGGYNLNFRTPLPGSEKEIAKFNQLLSTLNFINNPTLKTN